MPALAASLQITESYRRGMLALRKGAEREAAKAWDQIRVSDFDSTYPLGMLTLAVSSLQREGARLSSAYLMKYLSSELGEEQSPPLSDATQVGEARNGDDLRKALRAPLVGAKVAIADGATPEAALHAGRSRVQRVAGLAVDTAVREALRSGMEADERIEGWNRAVRGTCGACLGMAESSMAPPGTPLEIHPGCQCVSEPQVRYRDPSKVLADKAMFLGEGEQAPVNPIFSQADVEAVGKYVRTADSYKINALLRGTTPKSGVGEAVPLTEAEKVEFQAVADGIDAAMESAGKVGVPVRAIRTCGSKLKDAGLSNKKPPYTVTDLGFGSMSDASLGRFPNLGPEVGYRNIGVTMELTVNPEVRAIWGANASESELIVERGCRYVIRSVEKIKDKPPAWVVKADVLPPLPE